MTGPTMPSWPSTGLRHAIEIAPREYFEGDALHIQGWHVAPADLVPPAIVGVVRLTPLGSGSGGPGEIPGTDTFELEATPVARPDLAQAFHDAPGSTALGFWWAFPITQPSRVEVSIEATYPTDRRDVLWRQALTAVPPALAKDVTSLGTAVRDMRSRIASLLSTDDVAVSLDTPPHGLTPAPDFNIHGWCLMKDGSRVTGMRGWLGAVEVELDYGIRRTDVHAHFGFRPHTANVGFRGVVHGLQADTPLRLEARVLDRWIHVAEVTLRASGRLAFAWHVLRQAASHRVPRHAVRSRSARIAQVARHLPEMLTLDVLPTVLPAWHWASFGNFQQYPPRPVGLECFPPPSTAIADQLPAFTIVTPSFNQAPFLERTLDSVLSQQGVRCHYVVMDGGSTDGSVAMIEARQDALAAWTSGPDGGQSAAIRAGFQKAGGAPDDLMGYLNSDDVLMPGVLRFISEYCFSHPDVDVVYGHRVIVNADGLETGRWYTPRHSDDILRFVDVVPQETLFWRRRLYDRVGGIDPSFRFAMDWDLLVRFMQAGARMRRLPYFLACFRMHGDSKTASLSATVGEDECRRVRMTLHGRAVTPREIYRRFNRARLYSAAVHRALSAGVRW